MPGREYLEGIRTELRLGRRQRKMGQNVLSAFGYIRRRATAIQEINAALDDLGLVAHPPINSEMPLTTPRIRFELKSTSRTDDLEIVEDAGDLDSKPDDRLENADQDWNLPEPAFKVSELKSAKRAVEWVPLDAPIRKAYTKMVLNKYSQLMVASSGTPFQKDVKGIISFRSVTRALMNGDANIVGQCIEDEVPFAQVDTDLKSVVSQLSEHEVVLVIGRDNRLQGIVTAWDLAEEFAELVDPFKRIGEIEERLRTLTGPGIWTASKSSLRHARILACPSRTSNSPLSPVTCAATEMPPCSRTFWRTCSNDSLDRSEEGSGLRIPNSPRNLSSLSSTVSGG